jgi:hypothetical protein
LIQEVAPHFAVDHETAERSERSDPTDPTIGGAVIFDDD